MSASKNVSLSLLVLSVVFCVCLVASNLFETKLVQMGPISMTAGFLVFPISYIINDVVAEVWGYRKVRLLIWLGFFMNFLVVAIGQLAVFLPAAPFWKGEEHFDFVFGLAPRIACASFIAFIIGSFLNAWVMSRMKISDGGKHFSVRAVVSTLVGETGDSLIFFPIAFWGLVSVTEMLKLPFNPNGTRLKKWMFTFVLTDKSGRNALEGIVYSPNKHMRSVRSSRRRAM